MPRQICALIRHGDYQQLANTPSAHQPFPLTDAGALQAAEAAHMLQDILQTNAWALIPSIDSSNLLRAWQTAQLIGEALHNEYVVQGFDQLAERCLGSAANLSIDQIEEILSMDSRFSKPPPDWKSNSYYRLPLQGAESLLEAGKRVAEHITRRMLELRNTHNKNTLKLFVGHGAAFRHAAFHLGVLELEQIPQLSMYHCRPIYLELLPDNHWRHLYGGWKIRAKDSKYLD